LMALARSRPQLAGVFTSSQGQLGAMAQLGQALDLNTPNPEAVKRTLDPEALRSYLSARGIRCSAAHPNARHFHVSAFFREGDFVRGGIVEAFCPQAEEPEFNFQGHLEIPLENQLYDALENAARELELDAGPLVGVFLMEAQGPALVSICPCFDDALKSSYLAPLALGKSPIQAWFAALAQAGGPFDSMPHRPFQCAGSIAIRSSHGGVLGSIFGLERARSCAGIEGARAMLQSGSDLNQNPVVAVLWASGQNMRQVRSRLLSASERLNIRLEEYSAA
jgi:hypothetical protein